MAEHVVDLLEVVEIEEEKRSARTGAPAQGEDGFEPFEEDLAVQQSRQRVVLGQVADALLGAVAVGHVAGRAAIAEKGAALVEHGPGRQLHQAQLAGAVAIGPDHVATGSARVEFERAAGAATGRHAHHRVGPSAEHDSRSEPGIGEEARRNPADAMRRVRGPQPIRRARGEIAQRRLALADLAGRACRQRERGPAG